MDEYPKVIDLDGLKVTVLDAVDEARWREVQPNPLNDVVIMMDPANPIVTFANYDITTDAVTPEPVKAPSKKQKKEK